MKGWATSAAVILVAVDLLVGVSVRAMAADTPIGWFCGADQATGFHYDKSTGTWSPKIFLTDSKFMIRRPVDQDKPLLDIMLPHRLEPPAYVVAEFGIPAISYVCEHPPNTFGLMYCNSNVDQFTVNTRLLRMQFYSGVGYLNHDRHALPDTDDLVGDMVLEIGRCSPL